MDSPTYMGVSKNRGTPKWMVKIMETPIKMDDLGGKPTIFGNIHIFVVTFHRITFLPPLRQGVNSQEVMTFPQILDHPDAQQNNENGCHLYMRKSDTLEN